MFNENVTRHTTPLRNSKTVNKPFRSPLILRTNRIVDAQSPVGQSIDETSDALPERTILRKRSVSQSEGPAKRQCRERPVVTATWSKSETLLGKDLLELQERVRSKERELECRKVEVTVGKQDSIDLVASIDQWREGCQHALERFLNDVREQNDHSVTMSQVLCTLAIPTDLVRYSSEDDAFV